MEFKHKSKMAIEDFRKYVDDEDYEFAYAIVDFLSNKPNSHLHKYSESVIKQYAPSVLGKWVIGEYDGCDMTSHTNAQVIHGIVPPNQEVKYRYEDGYMIASVDVVLSKLYSDAYKVLRDDNYRAISIEELLGFTPETENFEDGVEEKEVIGFNICGITILGKFINPSIPNANIKLTQMSELDIDKAKLAYAKYSEVKTADNTMSEILSKLSKIEEKLNKEEHMAKDVIITKCAVSIGCDLWDKLYSVLKEKYPMADGDWITCKYWIKGVYEEGTEKFAILEEKDGDKLFKVMFVLTEDELTLGDELTEVAIDFVETNKMEMFTNDEISQYEETTKPETKKDEEEEEVEEPEVVENGCGSGEEDKSKMAELEEKVMAYEKEIAELKEFKEEVLNSKRDSVVLATMAKIKEFVDAETFDKYESSGNSCKYEDINGWRNEVLAEISELALSKLSSIDKKDDEPMDMGVVGTVVKQSKHKTCYDL